MLFFLWEATNKKNSKLCLNCLLKDLQVFVNENKYNQKNYSKLFLACKNCPYVVYRIAFWKISQRSQKNICYGQQSLSKQLFKKTLPPNCLCVRDPQVCIKREWKTHVSWFHITVSVQLKKPGHYRILLSTFDFHRSEKKIYSLVKILIGCLLIY